MIKPMIIAALAAAIALPLAAAEKSAAGDILAREVNEIGKILDEKGVVLPPPDVARNKVLDAVIKAIDPEAAILSKEQTERRQEEEKGVYYGIGLKIKQKDKQLRIAEVVKGGPAEAAGLKAGAGVEKIAGKSAAELTLEQALNLLRGGKDEEIELVIRDDEKDAAPRPVRLKRAALQMPVTGNSETWPQQIGYLKVNGIYEGSGGQIATQFREWAGTNCFGVILDLRGANGVNLEATAEVAGLFAPNGATLFTVLDGHNGTVAVYQSKAEKPLGKPVMVLTDRDTRGAAEALAAALQNCRGAMLVGAPTRGDDGIREPIALADGRLLYIATRRIDPGKGLSYRDEGVKPSVIVAQSGEAKTGEPEVEEDTGFFSGFSDKEKDDRALINRIGQDATLRRAADIILGLKALNLQAR